MAIERLLLIILGFAYTHFQGHRVATLEQPLRSDTLALDPDIGADTESDSP